MSDGNDPSKPGNWQSGGAQEPPWPESQTQSGWWGPPSRYPIQGGPFDIRDTQFQPDPRQFYPPERVYSRLAILAACFSFGSILVWPLAVLTGPAGAVMGHVAIARIKRTRNAGRGLAIASVIVGWAVCLLTLVSVALLIVYVLREYSSGGTSGNLPGTTTDDGSTDALLF